MMLLPFERGTFAVSLVTLNAFDVFPTRVEPPQNCHMAQIPEHTNYARSVRQPFPSNIGLLFSREMAVATVRPFQMLRSLFVIDTNFMILRQFLLTSWRNEIIR
jgi:hypothetical protein